jgi:hypothetical protein
MNSVRLYPILVFGAIAALLGYALLSRKNKKSEEDIERERRRQLTSGGRIIDGNITDVLELEDDKSGRQMILLVYTYDVAGVTYEASQDVTHLRQFLDLYSCRLGLPTSVRYDSHNPGDSIVISETWSGLRKFTLPVPPKARSGTRAMAQSSQPSGANVSGTVSNC